MFSRRLLPLYAFALLCIVASSCGVRPFTEAGTGNLNRLDTSATLSDKRAEKLISPYKTEIDTRMSGVIGYCSANMSKSRPESLLGNAIADLIIEYSINEVPHAVDLCVLNFGGLRTTLPKGDITQRKVYELMPFDNALVVLELSKEQMRELAQHILNRGGEPIASSHGVTLSKSNAEFKFQNEATTDQNTFLVITSDYLAQGGDGFTVFTQAKNRYDLNTLMRDALLFGFEHYTSSEQPLTATLQNRIEL